MTEDGPATESHLRGRGELWLAPSAAASFDERANALLARLSTRPPEDERQSRFRPERYSSDTLDESNIVEIRSESTIDGIGREVAKYFAEGRHRVGLEDDDYKEFARLASSVQRTKSFSRKVSVGRVEDAIFEWFRASRELRTTDSMSAFVLETCAKEIADYQIVVPFATLSIERPFDLARVSVCPLTPELLAGWLDPHVDRASSDDERAAAEAWRTEKLKQLQGTAAAFFTVRAELRRAQEMAHQEATAATALLRFYSVASLSSQAACYCVPLGQEAIPKSQDIVLSNGVVHHWTASILERRPTSDWSLSSAEIDHMQPLLEALTDLYLNPSSDFRERILGALMLYSRIPLTQNRAEKLVLLAAVLESLFLRNSTEPVQQNLSERLALYAERQLAERKAVKRLVKGAYALRSQFVHHAKEIQNPDDIQLLDDFMTCAWQCLFRLVKGRDQFRTKDEFLALLDDMKLS